MCEGASEASGSSLIERVVFVATRNRLADVLAVQLVEATESNSGVVLCRGIAGATLEDSVEEFGLDKGVDPTGPGEEDKRLRVIEAWPESAQLLESVLRRSDWLHYSDIGTFGVVAAAVNQEAFLQPAESDNDNIGLAQRA